MDNSRLLIATVLALVLVFAYQELVINRLYPPQNQLAQPHPTAASLAARNRENLSPVASSTASAAAASGAPSALGEKAVSNAPALAPAAGVIAEKEIEVDTNLYQARFTTRGARLKSFNLKDYRETVSPSSPLYEMVQPSSDGRLPLGVVVDSAGVTADDHDLDYATAAPSRIEVTKGTPVTIEFTTLAADGIKIRKSFTFDADSYAFWMDSEVSGAKQLKSIGLSYTQALNERSEGYYDIPELEADVSDKIYHEAEKALRKGLPPATGSIIFAGFGDRYFLTVFLPESSAIGSLVMENIGQDASALLLFSGTTMVRTQVYMGPKKLEALEAVNPKLTKSINFGWSGILALAFLRVLKVFHSFDGNWGWDIVLLTVALRLLMLPMSIKGQRSMIRMQRLQPQMERIRTQFKDDSERLNKEMVDLYKRNHVNPVGGCAPMVIQLPVFIGLYEALLNTVELRHAPFILWIKDLSAPDCLPISWMPRLPYINCHGLPVLVILMGISAYFQQKLTPTTPDPNQQRMMMLSPLIFTVFLVNFPAGLSVYYFASNVLGVIQQLFLNREFKQITPAT